MAKPETKFKSEIQKFPTVARIPFAENELSQFQDNFWIFLHKKGTAFYRKSINSLFTFVLLQSVCPPADHWRWPPPDKRGTNQIVVKNLRIVAQWWALCESHLLRLYFGVFQSSVVSVVRLVHYICLIIIRWLLIISSGIDFLSILFYLARIWRLLLTSPEIRVSDKQTVIGHVLFLAVVNTYYFGTQPIACPNYCKRQKYCQKGICPSDVIFGSPPQSCAFSHPLALAAFLTISWKIIFMDDHNGAIKFRRWSKQINTCFDGMFVEYKTILLLKIWASVTVNEMNPWCFHFFACLSITEIYLIKVSTDTLVWLLFHQKRIVHKPTSPSQKLNHWNFESNFFSNFSTLSIPP